MERLNIPVLFLIFNRPDTTRKVFEEIRKVQPRQLFVAADGPRKNISGECQKCEETREIVKSVDWDCEIKTLFREENLGCGKAVSSAISWFFEHVEEGIILEDDCLPHPSFFTFCEDMLNRYKDNLTVWSISGANFAYDLPVKASYRFSALPLIWGWATWRNRWQHYVFDAANLSGKQFYRALKYYFKSIDMRCYWLWKFYLMQKHQIDTWDYQFTFSLWLNRGLAIVPNTNLISNIGFGTDATHTTALNNRKAYQPVADISELIHPSEIKHDTATDEKLHRAENRLLKPWVLILRWIYMQIKLFLKK